MKYKITCILRPLLRRTYIYQDTTVIICDSEADAWDITTRLREMYDNAISDLKVEEIDEKEEKNECGI